MRTFESDESKDFTIPSYISKQILEDKFIKLLLNHSMEAAYTLNILYENGKFVQLSSTSNFKSIS